MMATPAWGQPFSSGTEVSSGAGRLPLKAGEVARQPLEMPADLGGLVGI